MSHPYDLVTIGPITMDFHATGSGADFAAHPTFAAAVGGTAATVAIGAAKLGMRSIAFGAIGDDPLGDLALRDLRRRGVATDAVLRKPSCRTSVTVLGAPTPGVGVRASYADHSPDDALTDLDLGALPLDAAQAILFAGSAFASPGGAATALQAAQSARDAQLISFLDLDLNLDRWPTLGGYGAAMRAALSQVDIAIGTELELFAALMPDPDGALHDGSIPPGARSELQERIEAQLEQGMLAIAMTRGGQGVTVIRSGDLIDVPGFPVSVVAELGAGEAFAAGLIRMLLRGHDWWDAARYGNACGALAVSRGGGAATFPTSDDVEKFVASRGGW
ncbi:MAG: PfkB family carbohydrate kinase [Acidimicrobiia bacterium]|nr:PfkB family carbohydrate kinase [Acidimicrobiia bacterium]